VVSPGRHPKKEIAKALGRAAAAGLSIEAINNRHRWGQVVCDSCKACMDVYSTPTSPDRVAKRIDRFIANHLHS
jgi:hypothetical protein